MAWTCMKAIKSPYLTATVAGVSAPGWKSASPLVAHVSQQFKRLCLDT